MIPDEKRASVIKMSEMQTAKFHPKTPSSLSDVSVPLKDSGGEAIGSVWVDGDCVAHVTCDGSFIELPQKFVGVSIGSEP